MQEIKTTLAELDALREKATQGEWRQRKNGTCSHIDAEHTSYGQLATVWDIEHENDAATIVALHNAYPAIRAYIEKLEREAEAGRVLAEAIENADRRITQNGADLAVYDALSAYHSATRDITSKEKEV